MEGVAGWGETPQSWAGLAVSWERRESCVPVSDPAGDEPRLCSRCFVAALTMRVPLALDRRAIACGGSEAGHRKKVTICQVVHSLP